MDETQHAFYCVQMLESELIDLSIRWLHFTVLKWPDRTQSVTNQSSIVEDGFYIFTQTGWNAISIKLDLVWCFCFFFIMKGITVCLFFSPPQLLSTPKAQPSISALILYYKHKIIQCLLVFFSRCFCHRAVI